MEFKNKVKKNLVEDCYQIKLSFFGKKLLYPINYNNSDDFDRLYNKENKALQGKQGYFTIGNNSRILHVFYSVDHNTNPKMLKIKLQKQENGQSEAEQNIKLCEDIAPFGIRPFLVCGGCNRKCTVLYKPAEQNIFKCRICSNIYYECQRISRHNMDGLFWYVHKLIKLAKKRESIKCMYYGGKLSKKGKRLCDLYLKWSKGIKEDVKARAQNDLHEATKEHGLKGMII